MGKKLQQRDMSLLLMKKMLNLNAKTVLIITQVLALASATGTKGGGNQWNQNPQQQWPQTKGPLGGWDDEVSNPRSIFPDEESKWKLEDSIPGVPGVSYPNIGNIPETSFDCRKQMGPGLYGDVETKCQVFHICQMDGRHNSFLCPTGTIFNQQTFVCDWWFNVNCADTSIHYGRNNNLYRGPQIGIDGSSVVRSGQGMKGNAQQPSVEIPGPNSATRTGNWPSVPQNQPQGAWTTNQGNQKGDNRPTNQRRRNGGQGWQNRGQANSKGNQGVRNSGRGQKGNRGAQNPNVNWQLQNRRTNQKGGNSQLSTGINNQIWNQRRDVNQGVHNSGGQMFNPQSGTKGGSTRPNVPGGFPGSNRNPGRQSGRRMGSGRGPQSTKGFDTNTWSIRSQNFRVTSQDRKGSSSDVLPDNRDSKVRAHDDKGGNLQNPDQYIDVENYEDVDDNNNWNAEGENYPDWNDNQNAGGGGYLPNENSQGHFGSEKSWNNEVNSEKRVSWQVNNEWTKDETNNDYDYS